MQFKKVMNETWENSEKPNFGSNLDLQIFVGFTTTRCYTLLQAIIVYNSKENERTKLEKMAKKLISDAIMGHLAQIYAPNTFLCGFNLYQMLDIVASYHCM